MNFRDAIRDLKELLPGTENEEFSWTSVAAVLIKQKPANAARREDYTFEVCAAEFERRLRAEAAAQGLEAAVFRTVDGDDQLIEAARPGRRLAIRLGAGTGSCWALAGSPDGARFGDLDTLDIADALRALGR